MNKSELLRFLHEIGASPKKWLSQNFLIDNNVIAKFVQLADVRAGEKVVEIGPGPGAITKQLLDAGAHVLAIEKDPLFAEALLRLQTKDQRLEVHCADILEFPFEMLKGNWKAVGNIPFKITAPILETLCNNSSKFNSFTLLIQKEVANRIQAKPKTKEISSLTIFLQFYTTAAASFHISAGAFYPKPSVESTALKLERREPPSIDPSQFFSIVRKAYRQRRKMLTSSLRDMAPDLRSLLEELKISPKARPEELSFDEWISLAGRLHTQTDA